MNNYTGTYKHDPTTFGGYVYEYDYEGYLSMSEIAGRILSDMRFDKKCKKMALNGDVKRLNKRNAKGTK